jgi:hypothetical protein
MELPCRTDNCFTVCDSQSFNREQVIAGFSVQDFGLDGTFSAWRRHHGSSWGITTTISNWSSISSFPRPWRVTVLEAQWTVHPGWRSAKRACSLSGWSHPIGESHIASACQEGCQILLVTCWLRIMGWSPPPILSLQSSTFIKCLLYRLWNSWAYKDESHCF